MVIKRGYRFDEIFNIFDEIDNNLNNLYAYKPLVPKKINKK